ncbi:cobyric acid synthase [Enterobacteriaceae bacterium H18W14]|uniref:cobyric acid synthase n=1 Tax=Dryocola boscaweniae TaxID=2925397 RepID=UPI0022F01A82|nr:cobyric acid synthase [Dryocola boscaweniae]MCT4714033.1 cobyric acid synthase [Dryocola boscaweniae]
MGNAVMIQGTASDVGKSVLVAGLCRIFVQDGLRVAPFKSQNMALNSGITPDGKEMGRAQIFQAEAAGIAPDVRMNPVLLKPTSDCKAQVVLMGKVATNMDAVTYHNYKPRLRSRIQQVYRSLASEYEVMVLEGAGSPAEINLRDRDIVNMGMAELAECPVILVADIDRGGVFAAIYGTLALLPEHEKRRVKGVIINKFRGDKALLYSGIEQIEALTGVPVLGVMPWLKVDLEDEDSVVLERGKYDARTPKDLDIAVIQLPYMSNFTDFNALAAQPDARLRYVSQPHELQGCDLVILPGSKNTLSDLRWVRENGFEQALLAHHQANGAVLGICGGYQMLGKHIFDAVESGLEEMPGIGLLDVVTRFASSKTTTRVAGKTLPALPGIFSACAALRLEGYEIHMGETQRGPSVESFAHLNECNALPYDSAEGAVNAEGNVLGTYMHGVFDNGEFTRALLNALRERKGLKAWDGEPFDYQQHKQRQFDILADAMREHIDIESIYKIMHEHQEQSCI